MKYIFMVLLLAGCGSESGSKEQIEVINKAEKVIVEIVEPEVAPVITPVVIEPPIIEIEEVIAPPIIEIEEPIEAVETQLTRVAFFGNSITEHGQSPTIGWYGAWGMAASMESLDYSNQVARMLGAIEFEKFNGGTWERNIGDYDFNLLKEVTDYDADIIIANIGENTAGHYLVIDIKEHLRLLLEYITNNSSSELLIVNSYYGGVNVNIAIAEFCIENDLLMVDVSEMSSVIEFTAVDLFDHAGVASHPSDYGMLEIANRVVLAINSGHEFELL